MTSSSAYDKTLMSHIILLMKVFLIQHFLQGRAEIKCKDYIEKSLKTFSCSSSNKPGYPLISKNNNYTATPLPASNHFHLVPYHLSSVTRPINIRTALPNFVLIFIPNISYESISVKLNSSIRNVHSDYHYDF